MSDPSAVACTICGGPDALSGTRLCNQCWGLQRHLEEALRTAGGRAYVHAQVVLARLAPSPFQVRAAEALADEVDVLVRRKVIDPRSPAADALLDYREPPSTERSCALADARGERAKVEAEVVAWLRGAAREHDEAAGVHPFGSVPQTRQDARADECRSRAEGIERGEHRPATKEDSRSCADVTGAPPLPRRSP